MAKYTELLSEYLEDGGILPSSFSQISGFRDLFVNYYCDKEIGFETEELFGIKLNAYASIFIPLYKQRIDDLASAVTGARNPTKTTYSVHDVTFDKGAQSNSTTLNAGAQKTTTTTLPLNGVVNTPSSIANADAFTNTDLHSEGARVDDTHETNTINVSGDTLTEAYFKIEKLNEKVHSLVFELLQEFKSCFMEIY